MVAFPPWTRRDGDLVLLRRHAGAAREVERDAGRSDVPSIPPRIVRTPENPRQALPPPVVGPPRVPGPGSGGFLFGDFAAQPGPGLGVIYLAKEQGGPGFTAEDAFWRTGVIALRRQRCCPRAPTAGRRYPSCPQGYVRRSEDRLCEPRSPRLDHRRKHPIRGPGEPVRRIPRRTVWV